MRYGLPEIGPLERALYLRSLAIFHDLGASELAACAQLTQERYVRRGETLYAEGQPIRTLYLPVEGRVRLERGGRRLRDLQTSDDMGLVELLAGQPYRLHAVAETNALVLAIDAAALLDLIEEHFPLFLQIRHALGAAVRQQQLALGSHQDAREGSVPPAAQRRISNGATGVGSHGSGLAEALLALQRTTVFRGVGLALLAALTSEYTDIALAPGELLWDDGAEPTFLALVMDGNVSCTPPSPVLAFRAGAGALLGVEAVFGDVPYAYRATAETKVVGHRIETQMLLDLAEDHFDLAQRILAHCAGELLRLKDLATDQPNQPAATVAAIGTNS